MDDDDLEDRDDDGLAVSDDDESAPNDLDLAEAQGELMLVVRVHEVMLGAGAELTIRVIQVAPTDEDPTKDFAASDVAPGNLNATVSVRS